MSAKKEIKRIGHKSARQAEKEALRDRLPDTVHGMHYNSRLPQPHLPDTAVTGGPKKKKDKSKWCKGHVGREHIWKFHPWNRHGNSPWHKHGWICERCTKKYWGTPPSKRVEGQTRHSPVPGGDHWSTTNIWARLSGYPCQCQMCQAD
jgi:hypothetical protein